MEKIIVKEGQILHDLALRTYGSQEGAFALASLNGLSVSTRLSPGQTIIYDPAAVINRQMVDYWKKNDLHASTDIAELDVFDESFSLIFE